MIGFDGEEWLETVSQTARMIFGGDAPGDSLAMHQAAARACVVYVIGVLVVRIGKSRLIGRSTALDVILGFILGSTLSRGITGHASMSDTAAASITLVALHWLLTAIACNSRLVGKIFKGNTPILVENGVMFEDNMRRSNISENDLRQFLRLRGIEHLAEVKAAHKERNGEISVIKAASEPKVVEIDVQDGVRTLRIEFGHPA